LGLLEVSNFKFLIHPLLRQGVPYKKNCKFLEIIVMEEKKNFSLVPDQERLAN
jgi:hypothetical protein